MIHQIEAIARRIGGERRGGGRAGRRGNRFFFFFFPVERARSKKEGEGDEGKEMLFNARMFPTLASPLSGISLRFSFD